MSTHLFTQRAAIALAALLATCGSASNSSHAQPAESSTASEPLPAADDGHRLRWTYPQFRIWQYVGSGLVSSTSIFIELARPDLSRITWDSQPGFDVAIDEHLGASSPPAIESAQDVSSALWYGTQAFAVLDSALTPLLTDDLNTEVAAQTTLINWQVMGLTGLASRSFHQTITRPRPSGSGASFISGHTALATASAALICSHHWNMPMYGDSFANHIPCALGLGAAATTGLLRLRGRKHWMSDVAAGWGVGSLLGFGMPWLLHYRYDEEDREGIVLSDSHAIAPWGSDDALGVSLQASF